MLVEGGREGEVEGKRVEECSERKWGKVEGGIDSG